MNSKIFGQVYNFWINGFDYSANKNKDAPKKTIDFSKTKKPKNDNVEFAKYVLRKYGGGIGIQYNNKRFDKQCQTIMKEESPNPRIHILMYAASLINSDKYEDIFIKVKCCISAGASGYDTVIELTPDLIKNSCFEWSNDPIIEKRDLRLYLIRAYMGKKQFNEALEQYQILHDQMPEIYNYIVGMVHCLIGLNDFDGAFNIIHLAKQSKYYSMTGNEYIKYALKYQYQAAQRLSERAGFPITEEQYFETYKQFNYETNIFKTHIDKAENSIKNAYAEKKKKDDYLWVKGRLPDICPKSYSAYSRMLSQKTEKFLELAQICQKIGRNIIEVNI